MQVFSERMTENKKEEKEEWITHDGQSNSEWLKTSVDTVLSHVLLETSWFTEMKAHFGKEHEWFNVMYSFDPKMPRPVRVMILVTSVITLMFLEALLFVLAYPDPGCSGFNDETTCLAEDSVYDQTKPACLWDQSSQTCHFNEPSAGVELMLAISLITLILATPFDVIIPMVIEEVLSKRIRWNLLNEKSKEDAEDETFDFSTISYDDEFSLFSGEEKGEAPIHSMDERKRWIMGELDALKQSIDYQKNVLILDTHIIRINGQAFSNLKKTIKKYERMLKLYDDHWHLNVNNEQDELEDVMITNRGLNRLLKGLNAEKVVAEKLWNIRNELSALVDNMEQCKDDGDREKLLLLSYLRERLEEKERPNFDRLASPYMEEIFSDSSDMEEDETVWVGLSVVSWVLVVSYLAFALFYLLLFGIQKGSTLINTWLATLILIVLQDIFLFAPVRIWLTSGILGSVVKKKVIKQFQQLIKDNEMESEDSIKPYFDIYYPDMVATRLALLYPHLRVSKIILRDLLFVTNDPTSLYLSEQLSKTDLNERQKTEFALIPSSSIDRHEIFQTMRMSDPYAFSIAPTYLPTSRTNMHIPPSISSMPLNLQLAVVRDSSTVLEKAQKPPLETFKLRSSPAKETFWHRVVFGTLLSIIGFALALPLGVGDTVLEVFINIFIFVLIYLMY
jgi:hypothetical protein